MTTKGPSRKQVIISMSKDNIDAFMNNSSLHAANINRQLCNVKSEVLTDYIRVDSLSITIVTSKVCLQSDLLIIDQYIKNSNNVNALQVEEPRLLKLKLYLKIISIPFLLWFKTQSVKSRNNSCIGVTQENSIEFLRQSSLPYIL